MPVNLTSDPDFMAAPPSEQMRYLSAVDPDFAKADPREQMGYIAHVRGLGHISGPQLPAAPQLSRSEEMPLSQATEDAKGNIGQTLRELGAPAVAGLAIGGGAGALGPGLAYGAGYATEAAAPIARALAPIAKRYGIKALEGAGLAYGWHLYRELKNVFEGNQ